MDEKNAHNYLYFRPTTEITKISLHNFDPQQNKETLGTHHNNFDPQQKFLPSVYTQIS